MTNNDLLAISELLDAKLEPIREAQITLQETQNKMQGELNETRKELKGEICKVRKELKGEICKVRSELKGEICKVRSELKGDICEVRSELKGDICEVRKDLKGDICSLQGGLSGLRSELNEVKEAQTRTGLLLENDVIPRLQNIETCYTDTYDKYSGGIAGITALKAEVDIMRGVIQEHSEKLQTL